jgi:hypothetical protein
MLKSNKLGRRPDPNIQWGQKNLSAIVIPDSTVPSVVCVLSGCPICSLARFNPVGKHGPKAIVEHPIMDPVALVMDAEIQPVVEPVAPATRCLTCIAPIGPGLPHPHCSESKEGRRKVKKERQKEARRRKVVKEVERRLLDNNNYNAEEEKRNSRMLKGAVARKNIIRDMLLEQSIKAQEQIMSEVLTKMGADKGLKDLFKLKLTRSQGGRDLEVHYTSTSTSASTGTSTSTNTCTSKSTSTNTITSALELVTLQNAMPS